MNVCRWVLDSDIRDGSDFGGGNGISHDIDFGDNNDSHKDRRGKMRSKPIYGERCLCREYCESWQENAICCAFSIPGHFCVGMVQFSGCRDHRPLDIHPAVVR
jgi:hypothetical protein